MAAAAGCLLAACTEKSARTAEPVTVKVEKVIAADALSVLEYPGKVKAAQDISLSFKVSGTLQKMFVEEGDHVRAGQLLAQLDATDYQVQLDATEAEYQQVKADAERVISLFQEDAVTASAHDKATYGLRQITAKRQHHQDQLAYTRLYAPFDGYVQKRLFEPHETVGAGMPVLSVISSGWPEVEISLPAADYVRRASFDTFQCTFGIYPGHTYTLKPLSITPKANANQLYVMRLQVVKADQPQPSAGMNTLVTIGCRADNGQLPHLAVPSQALLHKDNATWVFVYNADEGKVHAREVRLQALTTDGKAIVCSEQLKAGDRVVAAGIHTIQDGETVQPLAPETPTNVGGLL